MQVPDQQRGRAQISRLVAAALVVVALSFAQVAHADPDTVVVKGGNVLTGSIRAMDRGDLEFSVPNVGTVDIFWRNIERLWTERTLEVELTSGEHLSGPIRTPSPGQLEIRTALGPRTVPLSGVRRIQRIFPTFIQRTTGSVDLNIEYLQPNHQVNFLVDADATNRQRFYLTEASFSSLLTHINGEDFASRNDFELQTRRLLPLGWFVPVQFVFQQDKSLDLNYRFLIDAAGGKYLVRTMAMDLGAFVGLDYAVSQYQDVPSTDHVVEALGTIEWKWFESITKTELTTIATTYVALNTSRVRVEFDAEFKREFYRTFYFDLHLFNSYINSPPPPVTATNDFGLSFGLGYAF